MPRDSTSVTPASKDRHSNPRPSTHGTGRRRATSRTNRQPRAVENKVIAGIDARHAVKRAHPEQLAAVERLAAGEHRTRFADKAAAEALMRELGITAKVVRVLKQVPPKPS